MSWEPEEAGRTLPRGCPALPCDTPILVSGLWNLVTAPRKMTTMHRDTSKPKTGLLRYETRSVCKPTPHLRNASRSTTRAASDGADADKRLARATPPPASAAALPGTARLWAAGSEVEKPASQVKTGSRRCPVMGRFGLSIPLQRTPALWVPALW